MNDVKCKTCDAVFESEAGLKPCPNPSPGRPYVDTGVGNHIFDIPVDALVDSMAKSIGLDDEDGPDTLSYDEARSNMASMLGNFGYGYNPQSLAGFMYEMASFFSHKDHVTEEQFINAARDGWKRVGEDCANDEA